MTTRATKLLVMAAAMAATRLPGGLSAMPQPYQRRAIRNLEKGAPTAEDQERIAKAEAKRARKNARRRAVERRVNRRPQGSELNAVLCGNGSEVGACDTAKG